MIRTPVAIVAIFAASQRTPLGSTRRLCTPSDGNTAYVLQADSSLPVEGTDLKEHYPTCSYDATRMAVGRTGDPLVRDH